MKEINPEKRTVEEALNQPYEIPFYQREYKWGYKQFAELLNDLQDDFLSYQKPEDGRSDVAKYGHYFLGSIITTLDETNNKTILIDGQQRLTSLTLILCYIHNQRSYGSTIPDVKKWIYDESYGTEVFKLAVDDDRLELFRAIINNDLQKYQEIDSEGNLVIESLTDSAQNLYRRYEDIEDLIRSQIKENYLPHFTDWLTKKVILIGIKVPTEQDAHKVFVTMNDRGLNLSPTEMLKGYLLSNISNDQKRNEAHKVWKDYIHKLEAIGKDEDSVFIKNWLRSQYAIKIRERKKDAVKQDFDLIGEAYHNWVYENKQKLGLSNSDDYHKFIIKEFKSFAETYLLIHKHSEEFTKSFEHIYYNSIKHFSLQNILLLAGLKRNDSKPQIEKKLKIISRFIDYYLTIRIINQQSINYNTVVVAVFSIVKKIRSKKLADLKKILKAELEKLDYTFSKFEKIDYRNQKTTDILHLLARIGCYLDEESNQANSIEYSKYTNRRRAKKTYDIEHVLADKFEDHKHDEKLGGSFSDDIDFSDQRNKIGGLVLLPRDVNRSLKDVKYERKLEKYKEQNILTKTLSTGFYTNNPNFRQFHERSDIQFKSYDIFDRNSIRERSLMYKKIAMKIWSLDKIK